MDPLDLIESEIKDGLQNETDRLAKASEAHDFYMARFAAYDPRRHDELLAAAPLIRTAPIMRTVVQALGRHLYAKGPARALPDSAAASKWLTDLYARAGIDSLLQEADRLSFVAEVAALEVYGTDDPDRPVGIRLWPAHQFVVWENPDDGCQPLAVGVIDYFDRRRRLRVWTKEVMQTWQTEKEGPGQTSGGTAWHYVNEVENTFGVVPFAFVHCNQPTTDFWSGGPGAGLVQMNEYINFRLTATGDNLRFAGNPVTVIFGVGEGWRPEGPAKPGAVWYPTPGDDVGGNGTTPSIESFSHDLGTIEASWADLNAFLDLILECNGVPPAAIKMVESSSPSGVAIVAEQLPMIQFAEGRQRPFACYERDLARVALAVGRALEGREDLDPKLAQSLTLRWPSMVPEVPMTGKDLDDADERALKLGRLSLTQIIMRRFNMSREEALAHLEQVAKDRADEARISSPTPAPAVAEADPQSPTDESTDDDGQEDDDE